jgi:predicted peptidase
MPKIQPPQELQSHRYVVSLPDAHSSDSGPWPVIVFLHGVGEAAGKIEINEAARRHGPLHADNESRVNEFIVVFPQLPNKGGNVWGYDKHASAVEAIREAVVSDFHGDPKRFYLTGFSYGANGVFRIANRHPNYWTALWPVDATDDFSKAPDCPIWLSYGAANKAVNQKTRLNLKLEDAKLNPQGNRVYSYKGLDHVATARDSYCRDEVYKWLLTVASTVADQSTMVD